MDTIAVSLITTGKEQLIFMTSEQLVELSEMLQGDQYKGEVPMTVTVSGKVTQLIVLGFMVYGKAIHDYGKIIYFGKELN